MRYKHAAFEKRNARNRGSDGTSQPRLKNAKNEVTITRRDLQHTDHLSLMFDAARFRVVGLGVFTVSRFGAFDQVLSPQ